MYDFNGTIKEYIQLLRYPDLCSAIGDFHGEFFVLNVSQLPPQPKNSFPWQHQKIHPSATNVPKTLCENLGLLGNVTVICNIDSDLILCHSDVQQANEICLPVSKFYRRKISHDLKRFEFVEETTKLIKSILREIVGSGNVKPMQVPGLRVSVATWNGSPIIQDIIELFYLKAFISPPDKMSVISFHNPIEFVELIVDRHGPSLKALNSAVYSILNKCKGLRICTNHVISDSVISILTHEQIEYLSKYYDCLNKYIKVSKSYEEILLGFHAEFFSKEKFKALHLYWHRTYFNQLDAATYRIIYKHYDTIVNTVCLHNGIISNSQGKQLYLSDNNYLYTFQVKGDSEVTEIKLQEDLFKAVAFLVKNMQLFEGRRGDRDTAIKNAVFEHLKNG